MSDATTVVGYDAADEFSGPQSALRRLQAALHTYPWLSPMFVLVIAIAAFATLPKNGHLFSQLSNLGVITQQTAITGTLAIGQTLIILTAGIDLSCGAIMVFTQMVMAKAAFDQGIPAIPALLLGLLVGLLAGLINGFLVTKVKLPPFIVTLGTFLVFQAFTLLYATGRAISTNELATELKWLGHRINIGEFGITTGVLLMLALYGLFAYILRYTAWGTHVYAVGDDPDAARLAGIQSSKVVLSVYVVAGLIFGLAGWLLIGRVGNASPNSGVDANLDSITAVVIGGTSLFGGRGRVIGSLVGALIVGVVDNGLSVSNIDQAYKNLFIGLLIIGAVTADQWIRKARS